jgi:hypothetical protein
MSISLRKITDAQPGIAIEMRQEKGVFTDFVTLNWVYAIRGCGPRGDKANFMILIQLPVTSSLQLPCRFGE